MILKQCFGLDCYDSYQPKESPVSNWPIAALIGRRRWQQDSLQQFIDHARQSNELFLLRTHEKEKGDKSIYIVRDGRAVLASYQKFLRRLQNKDYSFSDLIEGKVWPGRWDEHVSFWLERSKSTTLVLRYEDLSTQPPLDQIGAFLDRPVLGDFSISFAELRAIDAGHFDVGHNGPGIEAVERDCSQLFWRHNETIMRHCGY